MDSNTNSGTKENEFDIRIEEVNSEDC